MTQGDFGHCVFLVRTGAADVTVDGQVVHRVGPGDVVGEVARPVLGSPDRLGGRHVAAGRHRALQA